VDLGGGAFGGERLDAHAEDEEHTDRGALPGAGDAGEDEAVVDDLDEQDTERGPQDRAPPAEDGRPAQDDGGDDVELTADQVLGLALRPMIMKIRPPAAAIIPTTTYTVSWVRATRKPARRAASGSPPMA